ncbi:MAG: DUF3343 domain-containing protein [Saccharofermentanales bacterium]|jgi:hypothetical protein
MREKTPKLVITFRTTDDAMAAEALLSRDGGRLIPVPQSIDAGCGLAWCDDVAQKNDRIERLTRAEVAFDRVVIVDLY